MCVLASFHCWFHNLEPPDKILNEASSGPGWPVGMSAENHLDC